MKILLIRPPSEIKMHWANIPLGISYIASTLEKGGEEIFIKDYMIDGYEKDSLINFIRNKRIDVVGLSFLTMDSYNAKTIIDDLKKASNVVIMVGGPHATVAYEEILHSGADYIVIGEGEKTVLDLMRCLKNEIPVDEVKGIAYKYNGNIRLTENREAVENLDKIPYPAFYLLNMEIYAEAAKHTGGFNILSSRGCPADCSFCNKKIFGYRIRKRSTENVIGEIELLYNNYGIKAFCFVDDYFMSSNKWTSRFCEQLKEKKIHAKYWAQGRVDNKIKLDVFKQMVDVGFLGISFGIESGDQRILDSINKRITPEQAKEAVSKARKAGFLMVEAGFILGFPQDTLETMERTVQLAVEVDTTVSHASFFTSFPGTKIQENIEQDSRVKFEKDYRKLNLLSPTLTTNQFNKEDLWKFYYKILFNKMKKRFFKEMTSIPAFLLVAYKSNQSIKQVAYMHFPAMIKYYKNIAPKIHSYIKRIIMAIMLSGG